MKLIFVKNKLIIIFFILIFFLFGCIVTTSPEQTDRYNYFVINEENIITYDIKVKHDYFAGLVLLYSADKNSDIKINILDIQDNYSILERNYNVNKSSRKYETLKVIFDEIQEISENKVYKITLSSNENIKIFGSQEDIYYRTIYKIEIKSILMEFIKKFFSDIPFAVFYLILLSVIIYCVCIN